MPDINRDRYEVRAVLHYGPHGATWRKYYIRELGAPEGEWVCRVYDPAVADTVCAAMNSHDWRQRVHRAFQQYTLPNLGQ